LKITIFNGKIHYKSPFSIATLNYQRVMGFSWDLTEWNGIIIHLIYIYIYWLVVGVEPSPLKNDGLKVSWDDDMNP
jgi:hypothetical protein